MKKVIKITLLVLGGLIALVSLIVLTLNITKAIVYKDYYSARTNVSVNEGLGDGFLPTGVSKITIDNDEVYLTCGYMDDGRPSRIYFIGEEETHYIYLKEDDYTISKAKFTSMTVTSKNIIVVADMQIFVVDKAAAINVAMQERPKNTLDEDEKVEPTVKVSSIITLPLLADYVSVDESESYLYVGGKTLDNQNCTYMYNLEDLGKTNISPISVYEVREHVRGFIDTGDKIIVVTATDVFSSSHICTYRKPEAYDSSNVYILDDRYLEKDMKTLPLVESPYYEDGKLYILFSSASNKEFFGKLALLNKIVAVELN